MTSALGSTAASHCFCGVILSEAKDLNPRVLPLNSPFPLLNLCPLCGELFAFVPSVMKFFSFSSCAAPSRFLESDIRYLISTLTQPLPS